MNYIQAIERGRHFAAAYGLKVDGDLIVSPGKFQSENVAILTAYDWLMNGDNGDMSQEDDAGNWVNLYTLTDGSALILHGSDLGFLRMGYFYKARDAQKAFALIESGLLAA